MGLIPVLPGNIEMIIIVMAVVYTAISIAAQRLLANPKKMREIQARVKIMQTEMNALIKSNAPQEQLMAKQKEFMPLISEQMKSSMKPMLVVLPLLLVTYYLIIPKLPIPSTYITSSKELFFIVVFGIGMVAAIVILLYDRAKGKEEMKELEKKNEVVKDDNSANYKAQNNQ